MQAIWNNQVIAQSDNTIIIENNHYFPVSSVDKTYLQPSNTSTHCPWKGDASYYSVVVNGEVNKDAAWYYSDPKDAAKEIKGYVAFWRGVVVAE